MRIAIDNTPIMQSVFDVHVLYDLSSNFTSVNFMINPPFLRGENIQRATNSIRSGCLTGHDA